MAKESGLGMTVSLDTSGGSLTDISNDITNCEWATPRETQDVTGLDKSAMERLLLLADFSATLNGVFNDDSAKSHAVLKTVPSTTATRTLTILVSGNTLSNEVLVTDYSLNRGANGELSWTAPCSLQSGTAPSWSP